MIFKNNLSKYFLVAGWLCILVGLGFILASPATLKPMDKNPPPLVSSNEEQTDVLTRKEKDFSGTETASGETATVIRVIDGDTIDVSINGKSERVRYIGMNTPETVDPRRPVQCFGKEASQKNKELVEGREVRLGKDITDRDAYGRLLRYVFVGGRFVNKELVERGYATVYTFPPNVKYVQEFLRAQEEARRGQRGLWQACRSGDALQASTPATVSSDFPAGTNSVSSPGCSIKGNINAQGEKIYHMVGCAYYGKTVIEEGKGERWFCSEEEALRAGWRKAGNCP